MKYHQTFGVAATEDRKKDRVLRVKSVGVVVQEKVVWELMISHDAVGTNKVGELSQKIIDGVEVDEVS